MAITITCLDDANHTISSSKKILSRQGELGETITFSLPSTLNAAYPRAWIMIQQPDGQLYYIDNGSGAGFTWPNPYTFAYNIGDRDTMLSSDGTLGIQIVLRDATPPAQTVEWRSRILYLTIEGSILSNVDSGGSLIDSLSSGTLNRLADIQYDSLADGDLLYRDTATGKWRNVTLVDGLNITHTLNKLTGELTLNSSGTIPLKADNILLDDTAGRISSTQVEGAIAEIAGTGRTIESLANIGLLSSLTTTEKGTVVGSINEVNAQLAQITPYNNAGSHNAIYRGKYLGSSVTAAQYAEISAGTFADMYIGDYLTIGGVNYRIAAFNYFLRCGDTDFYTNHITLVPDAPLYTAQMNTSNITTGAYGGSAMRVSNLASAIATIGSAFSGHVKTHRQLLANATSGGKASGWVWYDASVEIMNEVMVYGCSAWGGSTMNNGFQTRTSKSQLPLFAHRPDMISNRNTFWLRDVADSAGFAHVGFEGNASYTAASNSFGVRPAFCIG